MAQHPSAKAVSFDDLHELYRATQFQDTLADFIAQFNYPSIAGNTLLTCARNMLIPFHSVAIFHKVKFVSNDTELAETVDAIHVWLEQKDACGRIIPPRFDTALVLTQRQDGTDREFQSYCG